MSLIELLSRPKVSKEKLSLNLVAVVTFFMDFGNIGYHTAEVYLLPNFKEKVSIETSGNNHRYGKLNILIDNKIYTKLNSIKRDYDAISTLCKLMYVLSYDFYMPLLSGHSKDFETALNKLDKKDVYIQLKKYEDNDDLIEIFDFICSL